MLYRQLNALDLPLSSTSMLSLMPRSSKKDLSLKSQSENNAKQKSHISRPSNSSVNLSHSVRNLRNCSITSLSSSVFHDSHSPTPQGLQFS